MLEIFFVRNYQLLFQFIFSSFSFILLPLSFIFLCGCLTTEYNVGTRKQDIYFYSSESEINMGQNIAKRITKEFKISNNPNDIQRVSEIGRKIANVVDRQGISYYFYIIEEDDRGRGQVNAFSLPGGYSYIFKDLLELLDNDDQLAFILAHEAGHIVSRHHIKRLQAAMGYTLAIIASTQASADRNFANGVSFALAQLFTAYSRQDEFNADELAVKYCKAAGYDPSSGIEVLEKLYLENKKEIRPLSYFKTHPYPAQRIRHIKEVLKVPLGVDDYVNF